MAPVLLFLGAGVGVDGGGVGAVGPGVGGVVESGTVMTALLSGKVAVPESLTVRTETVKPRPSVSPSKDV